MADVVIPVGGIGTKADAVVIAGCVDKDIWYAAADASFFMGASSLSEAIRNLSLIISQPCAAMASRSSALFLK
jgi:hypothetical protein